MLGCGFKLFQGEMMASEDSNATAELMGAA